jgi:hypothetical protein
MINLFLSCIIFTINIAPKNLFLDHYIIIPSIGRIKAIATSPLNVFAISDNNLIIFDKQTITLKKTISFDEELHLIGYDQYYNDLWIMSNASIIRLNVASYSIREYMADGVYRFGIGQDYLYLDGLKDYSLNKRTGELKIIHSFPGNLFWFKKTTNADIKKYPFLTPYYYYDELPESQAPLSQFPITTISDDGMNLYVGTDGYGILKYNKISWQKQRVIYGPLDSNIKNVKIFDNNIYFISSLGISYYPTSTNNWQYQRFRYRITDFLFLDNNLIVSFNNQISRTDGGMLFSISNFATDVLVLNSDSMHIYIGTRSGLFKMYKGTSTTVPFGPDRFPVYSILPVQDDIFVGGEFALYKYTREKNEWSKVLPYGVKDIIEIKDELYLLGLNNQVIRYRKVHDNASDIDTSWILLPYFNIYDIDTDNEVLYCASYAGIYYYDPKTDLYKVIYNLPRIKYDYIFVVGDNIVSVSGGNIYSLPIKYRD